MNAPGAVREKSRWLWIAYLFFMLFVFWTTSPFMFNWPLEEKLGEHVIGGLPTGIEQARQGNPKRRAGILVLAVSSLVLLARTKNRFQVNGVLGWTIIFYWGWMLFSLTWSIDPMYTLRRLAVVLVVWFAAVCTAGRYSLRELAILAVFVTGISLALGVGNELRLGTIDLTNEWWRFSGIFHCVSMGWNCGLLAMSAMFLVTGEKRRSYRIGLWIIIVAAIVFLLLTKTRTAVVAAILGIGFYWFRVVSTSNKIFMVLGVIILLSVSYVALGDRLLYYGEEASTLGRGESAKESVGSLTGRLPLWNYCFKYAAERPLLGYGFSSFINPDTIDDIYREVGWPPSSIHSGYINELMGTGFIGMGALITLLVLALRRALLLSKQLPVYLFVSSMIIWLSVNLFLEANLIIAPSFMTFFVMMLLVRLAFLPAEEWR